MPRMTTAEAVIETLLAHGIDTLFALPGVHNDHLFDAAHKASDRIRGHPPAARADRRLHGARRRAGDGEAAGVRGGAGAGCPERLGRAAAGPCAWVRR